MSQVTRRSFNSAVGSGLCAAALPAQATRPPNIVFLCSDQHSGPVMGCNGHPIVRSPNMDRLASMGVNFRNTYCGNPVSVPSRTSMMTGMYASDLNSYCNSTPFDGRVPAWTNRLHDGGYHCWATGKLDLERERDYGLVEVQTSHGHSRNPDITSLFRRPVSYRVDERGKDGTARNQPSADKETVARGLKFLRGEARRLGKPWMLYLGLQQPHPGFEAMPKYLELYPLERIPLPHIPPGYLDRMPLPFQVLRNFKLISNGVPPGRVRRCRASYYGMISELDAYVGEVIDELEASGEIRNTVFIYTSDHGEMLGEHGMWLKNVLLDNAARVPLIIAGPGFPKGKTVETPVAHVDLAATLLEIAHLRIPSGLRGHSLLPLAQGGQGDHPGFAFSESHSEGNCTGSFMIRKGDWKYIHFTWYGELLFHLKDDPGELNNLAGKPEYAGILRERRSILTSQLDPEAVTQRAFQEQERRLRNFVRAKTAEEFFQMLRGRLGPGQARVLTGKYYPG
jgi:choline-sulfatase